MGDSCISELDLFYTSEDPYDVAPRPPEKPHLSLPDRCKVSLPVRASAASLPVDNDSMEIEDTPCTSSKLLFGFPVSVQHSLARRPPLSRTKSSGKPLNRRGKTTAPSHCVRPARQPVAAPTEVFQSITATPGLGERSFEEMRAECYAMSAITIGKPPRPVASVSEGTGIPVKLMTPTFAPFVVPPANEWEAEQLVPTEQRDFAMSHDALSADFTFATPLAVKA